jgi:antitoxin (DNA-binding transcriptional repressor) of toxin-antitoxin stability system
VITKHGQPVARLSPVRRHVERPADVIAAIRETRRNIHLAGLSIRDMIEEGRR